MLTYTTCEKTDLSIFCHMTETRDTYRLRAVLDWLRQRHQPRHV